MMREREVGGGEMRWREGNGGGRLKFMIGGRPKFYIIGQARIIQGREYDNFGVLPRNL